MARLRCVMIDKRFKVNHAGATSFSHRIAALRLRTPAEAWSSDNVICAALCDTMYF